MNSTTPEVIGKGSYGCVFRPSLRCKNGKKRPEKGVVSKLMTAEDALSEQNETSVIDRFDSNFNYHLKSPSRCSVDPSDVMVHKSAVSSCGRIGKEALEDPYNYNLLLLQDGGLSMEKYSDSLSPRPVTEQNKVKCLLFLKEARRLMLGINSFLKNDFVVHDIKPQNIVFDENKNRLNFIDFGLAIKRSTIMDKLKHRSRYFGCVFHWSYPWETEFLPENKYLDIHPSRQFSEVMKGFNASTINNRWTDVGGQYLSHLYDFFETVVDPSRDVKRQAEQYFNEYRDFLNSVKSHSHAEFIEACVNTIDTFGVGMSFMHWLNRAQAFLSPDLYRRLYPVFRGMVSMNVFKRWTPQKALAMYDAALATVKKPKPVLQGGGSPRGVVSAAKSPQGAASPRGAASAAKSPQGAANPEELFDSPLINRCITNFGNTKECTYGLSDLQKRVAVQYKHANLPKKELTDECNSAAVVKKKNAAKLSYVQDFLHSYVTPTMEKNGMLLWHSTGSGKTCTAVSIASNFEAAGYLIIYVTGRDLVSDVAKNMFGQFICHTKNIEEAEGDMDKVATEYSKQWVGGKPLTYRTFTNLIGAVDGTSQEFDQRLYSSFMKNHPEERKADVFYKTLLIIDEAQKLYGNELSATEKPDANVLLKRLQASYAKSAEDPAYPSAKVILMTATPISKNPFELCELLNLLRLDPLPKTQAEFVKQGYMDSANKVNVPKLFDAFEGYISVVDYSEKRTQFAGKVIHDVRVPMSDQGGSNSNSSESSSEDAARRRALIKQIRSRCKGSAEECSALINKNPEIKQLDRKLAKGTRSKQKYNKKEDFSQLSALKEIMKKYLPKQATAAAAAAQEQKPKSMEPKPILNANKTTGAVKGKPTSKGTAAAPKKESRCSPCPKCPSVSRTRKSSSPRLSGITMRVPNWARDFARRRL